MISNLIVMLLSVAAIAAATTEAQLATATANFHYYQPQAHLDTRAASNGLVSPKAQQQQTSGISCSVHGQKCTQQPNHASPNKENQSSDLRQDGQALQTNPQTVDETTESTISFSLSNPNPNFNVVRQLSADTSQTATTIAALVDEQKQYYANNRNHIKDPNRFDPNSHLDLDPHPHPPHPFVSRHHSPSLPPSTHLGTLKVDTATATETKSAHTDTDTVTNSITRATSPTSSFGSQAAVAIYSNGNDFVNANQFVVGANITDDSELSGHARQQDKDNKDKTASTSKLQFASSSDKIPFNSQKSNKHRDNRSKQNQSINGQKSSALLSSIGKQRDDDNAKVFELQNTESKLLTSDSSELLTGCTTKETKSDNLSIDELLAIHSTFDNADLLKKHNNEDDNDSFDMSINNDNEHDRHASKIAAKHGRNVVVAQEHECVESNTEAYDKRQQAPTAKRLRRAKGFDDIDDISSDHDGFGKERLVFGNEQNLLELSKSGQPDLVYTNQFVLKILGGEDEAKRVASKHNFTYLNHIIGDFYHLEHNGVAKRFADFDTFGAETNSTTAAAASKSTPTSTSTSTTTTTTTTTNGKGGRLYRRHTANDDNNNKRQQRIRRKRASDLLDELGALMLEEREVLSFQVQTLKKRVKRDLIDLATLQAHMLLPASLVPAQPPQPHPGPSQRAAGQVHAPNQLPVFRPAHAHSSSQDPPSSGGDPLEPAASNANLLAAGLQRTNTVPAPLLLMSAGGVPRRPPTTQVAQQQNHHHHHHTHHVSANLSATISKAPFNDPSWPLMWYLDGGARNGFDLNVLAAWKMGFTGRGVVITILDDGLEKSHPDLQANYDPRASLDINGEDEDPMPRYDAQDSNRHGTRCAGEVAAVSDNNICSIGIAFNSKVGGVRMLDGDVTDAVEARSLSHNNQHVHIYSASWGPDDNGKTTDGPGELATRAFIDGVTNGRHGLGSIFVFASGNGGREFDNCNCDGYTNAIWTLSISSATENGLVPWYTEACSSTLATTYSSGSNEERQISTTDLHHTCTNTHTGTSASAPLAAGICALVLEANPKLTWRDMQHIVVRTARPANLVARDWRANALGRNVSHSFGYGLMDAGAMVVLARKWTSMPVQYTCEVRSPPMDKFVGSKSHIELKLRVDCANVKHLEHVQSKVTLAATRRGDVHIYLVSPSGTKSTLLAQRPNDLTDQGFKNWPFMSVHSWGESANGIWTLEVHHEGKPNSRAHLKEWTLILYGTAHDPNKHLDSARHLSSSASSHQSHNNHHNKHSHAAITSSASQAQPQANNLAKQQQLLPPPVSYTTSASTTNNNQMASNESSSSNKPSVQQNPRISANLRQHSPPPPPPPSQLLKDLATTTTTLSQAQTQKAKDSTSKPGLGVEVGSRSQQQQQHKPQKPSTTEQDNKKHASQVMTSSETLAKLTNQKDHRSSGNNDIEHLATSSNNDVAAHDISSVGVVIQVNQQQVHPLNEPTSSLGQASSASKPIISVIWLIALLIISTTTTAAAVTQSTTRLQVKLIRQ